MGQSYLTQRGLPFLERAGLVEVEVNGYCGLDIALESGELSAEERGLEDAGEGCELFMVSGVDCGEELGMIRRGIFVGRLVNSMFNARILGRTYYG